MIELLGTDVAWLGQRTQLKLLLYLLLDHTDARTLTQVDDADAGTLLACTAGTAASVGVVLHVVGHSIVDDMGEVIHIQSARSHIGGHQQLGAVVAELLHGEVALLLREVAMQGVGIVAIAYEIVGHLLRLGLRAAEDDGIDAREVVHHPLQGSILVLGTYHIIYVVDILGTLVAAAHLYLVCVAQVFLGYALYLLAHGSAEEQRSVVGRHALENAVEVVLEAHGEHFIGLIEDDAAHLGEVGHPAVHQINKASGGSHHDIHAMLQGAYLRLDACSAIHCQHADVGQIMRKVVQILGYLDTQLAGGSQYQGPHLLPVTLMALGCQQMEQGKAIGRGLSRSCLR